MNARALIMFGTGEGLSTVDAVHFMKFRASASPLSASSASGSCAGLRCSALAAAKPHAGTRPLIAEIFTSSNNEVERHERQSAAFALIRRHGDAFGSGHALSRSRSGCKIAPHFSLSSVGSGRLLARREPHLIRTTTRNIRSRAHFFAAEELRPVSSSTNHFRVR